MNFDDIISPFYFDRSNGYNIDTIWKLAKAAPGGARITKKNVQDFASKTRGRQVFQGKVTDIPLSFYANYPGEKVQIDLTVMPTSFPGGYKYMFSLIDIFSRYGFLEEITNKRSETVLGAFKKVEQEAAKVWNKEKPFEIVEMDNGSEFFSVFERYCNEQGYEMRSGQPGDKHFMSLIERFHRTIKEKSGEMLENDGLNKAQWPEVINDFLTAYNKNKHSGVGASPQDIVKEKAYPQMKRTSGDISMISAAKNPSTAEKLLKVGDQVRHELLSERPGKAFGQKAFQARWSQQVYEVKRSLYNKYIIGSVGSDEELDRAYARRELFKVNGGVIEAPARLEKAQRVQEEIEARRREKEIKQAEIAMMLPLTKTYNLRPR